VRAFVTGASGFLGHAVCAELIARNSEVSALARRPETHQRLAIEHAKTAAGVREVDLSLDLGIRAENVAWLLCSSAQLAGSRRTLDMGCAT
jgi:NADP-dependent 3-hydroxy acid dehydrogenase YdfG